MIQGRFGPKNELIFPIELIAANGERFEVEAMLDTGFTSEILYLDSQDADALGWEPTPEIRRLATAWGEGEFQIYEAKIALDSKEFEVEAVIGDRLIELLLGSPVFNIARLQVDKHRQVLTLEIIDEN
ncbi:MAG: aspartyl protease [Microcoleaceae cyanobacterium]